MTLEIDRVSFTSMREDEGEKFFIREGVDDGREEGSALRVSGGPPSPRTPRTPFVIPLTPAEDNILAKKIHKYGIMIKQPGARGMGGHPHACRL